MASGLNQVQLCGNIGGEPELRSTGGGVEVLNLTLATTERVKKLGEWTDHTEWHRLVIWGGQAVSLYKVVSKGDRLFITGGLRTTSWTDAHGAKKYTTEIHCKEIIWSKKQ